MKEDYKFMLRIAFTALAVIFTMFPIIITFVWGFMTGFFWLIGR